MKGSIFFIALAACMLFFVPDADAVVKANLAAYLEKVPAPPKTAQEAYGMNELMEKLSAELKKIEQEVKETSRKDLAESPLANDPEKKSKKMKKYKDRDLKKKYKTMTDEEKTALGMQMSREMGMMDSSQESQKATNELPAIANLNNDLLRYAQEGLNIVKKMDDIEKKHTPKTRDIEEEKKSCPKIDRGQQFDPYPDPKCVHAKTLQILDHNIQIETSRLKEYQKLAAAFRAKIKPPIVQLNKRLAAINYGADIKDPKNKIIVNNAQTAAFDVAAVLFGIVSEAHKGAAGLISAKLEYEKNYKK